jgi:hypothetical protein
VGAAPVASRLSFDELRADVRAALSGAGGADR